jgi:uncharacterized peroxidase-related enzyme
MSRVPLLTSTTAPVDSKAALGQIHTAFGTVPNMFRAVANSSAALTSMWGSFGALGQGRLPPVLGEKVAVAIANRNGCEYCLAAHTALGRKAGATSAEMGDAQAGHSDDPHTLAALRFALALVERRGHVEAIEVEQLREAGFDDGEIVELIAHVGLNLFTNYVNVSFDVPLDFPTVALRKAA